MTAIRPEHQDPGARIKPTGTFIVEIDGLENVGHGELLVIVGDALRDKDIEYRKLRTSYVERGAEEHSQ